MCFKGSSTSGQMREHKSRATCEI